MRNPNSKYTKPGSMVQRVAEAVRLRGAATIDHLEPDFPEVTRKQIQAALANARDARLIRAKVPGRRHCPSVWEFGSDESIASPFPQPEVLRPVPSVFALADPIVCPPEWPPLPTGRVIEKLGSWEMEFSEAC